MMLFAVHISDGVLTWPWLTGGFALMALMLWLAAWRIRDDEIPRVALLTAAFFISSSIHIKVPPTSVHLMLCGLVGVVLGWRAPLAIFVGLLLQVVLLEHGGRWTLGINTAIMVVPALLSFLAFRGVRKLRWMDSQAGHALLVGTAAVLWFLGAVYAVTLVCDSLTSLDESGLARANATLLQPWVRIGAGIFAGGAVLLERRLRNAPGFALGFLIGVFSVLLTAGLNCAVLLLGGETTFPGPAFLMVIVHLPIALVEGLILGVTVGFLSRVKPELLVASRAP